MDTQPDQQRSLEESDKFIGTSILMRPFAIEPRKNAGPHGDRCQQHSRITVGLGHQRITRQGNFRGSGPCFLFTVRNWLCADLAEGRGMLVCRGRSYIAQGQISPMHPALTIKAETSSIAAAASWCWNVRSTRGWIGRPDARCRSTTDGWSGTLAPVVLPQLTRAECHAAAGRLARVWGERQLKCADSARYPPPGTPPPFPPPPPTEI